MDTTMKNPATLTADTITDAQIEQLRDEAGLHGDIAQVDICELALAGNRDCRAECARAIDDAQAQRDEPRRGDEDFYELDR